MSDTTTEGGAAKAAPWCPAIADEVERQIAEKLVRDILAAGYTVSVNDGEVTTLRQSTDLDAIAAAMATTEEDYLYAFDAKHTLIGWVRLIWGNGADLISDYSANPGTEAMVAGAEALADRFNGGAA